MFPPAGVRIAWRSQVLKRGRGVQGARALDGGAMSAAPCCAEQHAVRLSDRGVDNPRMGAGRSVSSRAGFGRSAQAEVRRQPPPPSRSRVSGSAAGRRSNVSRETKPRHSPLRFLTTIPRDEPLGCQAPGARSGSPERTASQKAASRKSRRFRLALPTFSTCGHCIQCVVQRRPKGGASCNFPIFLM